MPCRVDWGPETQTESVSELKSQIACLKNELDKVTRILCEYLKTRELTKEGKAWAKKHAKADEARVSKEVKKAAIRAIENHSGKIQTLEELWKKLGGQMGGKEISPKVQLKPPRKK